MGASFYEFILRYKDEEANDPMSRLANQISQDRTFPKQSQDFDQLSTYMEQNSDYSRMLTLFDDALQTFQEIS